MHLNWQFDPDTMHKWSVLVHTQIHTPEVQERIRRTEQPDALSKNSVWRTFIICHITSQQRSGPGSPVSRLIESHGPIFDYDLCLAQADRVQFMAAQLSSLRRFNIIAGQLNQTIDSLEQAGWTGLLNTLSTLTATDMDKPEKMQAENQAVAYMQTFKGLGPKQSRNFLQMLGLARHEIPIDSRTLKRLREFGCTFVPEPRGLSDPAVYELIQTGLREIADQLGIEPFILDACIFNSFDTDSAQDK